MTVQKAFEGGTIKYIAQQCGRKTREKLSV